jgi:hypothetical protein
MNKTYVIKNDDGYIRICEDGRRIEIVPYISKATFFDSENFAYEGMLKNKKAFYSNYNTFYRIECVVVVFGDI